MVHGGEAVIRTPSNLEILLHFHASPEKHPRYDAPAVREGVSYLLEQEMLARTKVDFVYTTTEKAKYYLSYLMAVPFPVVTWRMPEKK